jgi:hypothetical protein
MQVPAQLLIESMPADADYTVAIPKTSLESQSIMAITIGTSEIVAHAHGNRRRRKSREWETIMRLFGIEQPERLLEGPGRLPLPLPQFVQLFQPSNTELPQFPSRYKAEDVFDLLPPDVQFDHCWIYVVRNLNDEQPELTPQGTLTARSRDDGLELLGAQEGDTMVLTAAHPTMPCVLQGSIGQEGKLVEWDNRTPTSLPLIQVVPQQMNPAHQRASVRVQVIADKHPDQVWVFPLGGAESAIQMQHQQGSTVWESAPNRNTTLDGHVLARWGQEHLLIVPFSQGGGPPSNGAFAPVPITAGSADGGVMIFFYDKNRHAREKEDEFSRVKVVTTTNNAAYGTRPNLSWRPYSYPFTIASNGPLPLECVPTLVVRHEQPGERELLTGDLLIGRLQGDQWTVQPTYLPAGAPFVAMPLTDTTAPGLFHQRGGIEHYQVFWVPRLIS